ncbi:hypothetical protein ACSBR1_022637 [Camellia fascicularis]
MKINDKKNKFLCVKTGQFFFKATVQSQKLRTLFHIKDTFFNKPKRGEDYAILQALLSIDMLILFLATFCGLGSSLTTVDILEQIGKSLEYPQQTIKTFVSLLAYGITSAKSSLASLLKPYSQKLFGLKYYSLLFNYGQLASPLWSYILNVKVTWPLYDREALKELERKGLS